MAEKVRIYTTSYCGYCRMAKQLLAARNVTFDEIDVTADPDTRDWLVESTGRHTVPQIFVGDRPVGGFTELRELDASGTLDRLLGGTNTADS